MGSLVGILLPLLIQFGPALIKDVVDLIHGNPRVVGETDEAYIMRLQTLTEQNIQATLDQNKTVEES